MIVFPNLMLPSVSFTMNLDGIVISFHLKYQFTSDSWFLSIFIDEIQISCSKVVKNFPLFSSRRARLKMFGDIYCIPSTMFANNIENIGLKELNDGQFGLVYISDSELSI